MYHQLEGPLQINCRTSFCEFYTYVFFYICCPITLFFFFKFAEYKVALCIYIYIVVSHTEMSHTVCRVHARIVSISICSKNCREITLFLISSIRTEHKIINVLDRRCFDAHPDPYPEQDPDPTSSFTQVGKS
jgi:hypothetical protein